MSTTFYFASTYGSSNYDSTTYNGATTASQTSTRETTTTGGLLTNTGADILVFVSIAALIIFAALVIRIWHRTTTAPSSKGPVT